MDISKITGADAVVNTGKTKVPAKADIRDTDDKVSITAEAKRMAEVQNALNIVKGTPDVRAEKIERARQLIASGEYSNKEILDKIADKLLRNLGS
jgi:flagellar biosynthesis anti-sigma factor FlgM